VPNQERKDTDDVSGAAVPLTGHADDISGAAAPLTGHADDISGAAAPLTGHAADFSGPAKAPGHEDPATDPDGAVLPSDAEPEAGTSPDMTLEASFEPDPDTLVEPPGAVAELAAACVRFVATRYGIHLDFSPDTLSLVDQWLRDARGDMAARPELVELVEGAAGAYLGEVVRRAFGGEWLLEGEQPDWRLGLTRVYCAFNPIGMAREAMLLGEAEGWHAHFELDPGDKEEIDARLAALPEVSEDEYYAPSTRFDVVNIVVDALREKMRASGLSDVRFTSEDYVGV
jgi:hypothetical protein